MGDLMLHGVLNMPLPDDPSEMGAVEWFQFRERARQASQRIAADADRIEELEAKLAKVESAAIDVGAALVAAISLLEKGGKKAAPSNKMFDQMIADYKNSLERTRTTLAELKGETNDK